MKCHFDISWIILSSLPCGCTAIIIWGQLRPMNSVRGWPSTVHTKPASYHIAVQWRNVVSIWNSGMKPVIAQFVQRAPLKQLSASIADLVLDQLYWPTWPNSFCLPLLTWLGLLYLNFLGQCLEFETLYFLKTNISAHCSGKSANWTFFCFR